jgi:hypothetical protein
VQIPDPARSRAVLIGTSKYRDEKLPDLPQVGQGIRDLAAAFTHPTYGLLRADNCEIVEDEHDLGLIGGKLLTAAEQAEDLLLVYFSGHGIIGGRRHDLYLAVSDSAWASPTFTSLKYDDLRNAVLDSPAATKMIILDCCFSGRAATEKQADPAELLSQIEVEGTYVLTATHQNQVALIVSGEEHTAFTGRLLRLLREGIDGGPEFLTTDHIFKQLRIWMRAAGLSEPQKRATGTSGQLPLSRNPAFAASTLPLLRQQRQAALNECLKGNWEEGREQLRDTAQRLDGAVGPGHKETLYVRMLLAHATGATGMPSDGAEMLRMLLPEQARLLGEEHEITLTARQYLAVNLGEAGYRDQAVTMLRVLLPDRRRILGNDDEHTLRTVHMLARNLAATGEIDEAIALLKELVPMRERVLGSDHSHTARARRDLAALLGREAR